jgi:hypothetical protein
MKFAIRWKKQLLAGAVITTAVVIVWGVFVFAGIWLRVQCVRELTKQARPLDEIALYDPANPELAQAIRWTGWDVSFSGDSAEPGADLLDRLEELQRPGIRIVLRNLFRLWTRQNQPEQLSLVQTIALNSVSQGVSVIQVADGQADESAPASVDVVAAELPTLVNTGQWLTQITLWHTGQSLQVYSITDSRGEKVLVVSRSVSENSSDEREPSEGPTREILIVDSAGQILDRLLIKDSDIVGRFAESHAVADQVVFGKPCYGSLQSGTFQRSAVGPGTVRIIDRGKWKTVRTIEAPSPSGNVVEPEQTPLEN